MKKKIRKTGEIIDVITYSCGSVPQDNDTLECIDSKGERKTHNLNYYWDLEDVDFLNNEDAYWENFRNQAALTIFAARMDYALDNRRENEKVLDASIKDADDLIKKLKSTKK